VRVAVAGMFVVSVLGVLASAGLLLAPILPPLTAAGRKVGIPSGGMAPAAPSRAEYQRAFLYERARRRLIANINREKQAGKSTTVQPQPPSGSVVAAFYVNWDDTSKTSLKRNIQHLTHVIPEWLKLKPDGYEFDTELDDDVTETATRNGVAVVPLISNYHDDWQPESLHQLLRDRRKQDRLIASLRSFLLSHRFAGINLDLEQLDVRDRRHYVDFVRRLGIALHQRRLLLTIDLPVGDPAYDAPSLARYADWLMPMLYDEHDQSGTAGPIASNPWLEQQLATLCQSVPASKIVAALGAYAYDWKAGGVGAEPQTFAEATRSAQDAGTQILLDGDSGNAHFAYWDDARTVHQVWLLDACTAYNHLRLAEQHGVLGVAVWRIGSEDPSVWSFLDPKTLYAPFDVQTLKECRYGYEVDFDGQGEVLQIVSGPSEGQREIRSDPKTGLIVAEKYTAYPSPWVVHRFGGHRKEVAITFDDGPDERWTPGILDILKRENVPATFFLIGTNAENAPDLVRRIYAEGHEIGNHTFTHPNIAEVSRRRVKLELNATQRVIEAAVGRSTLLFRPPYNADAEPTSPEELLPIVRAQQLGYVTVGESIDPQDWARPGVEEIEKTVMQGANAASVILLHDGGGDRSDTLEALPIIIARLRAAGFRFVSVSSLIGKTRDAVMPPVSDQEDLIVGADRYLFTLSFGLTRAVGCLFVAAIVLGISRVVFTGLLAGIQARFPHKGRAGFRPPVTVVIPAYNEESTIARTVQSILASRYDDLEVIVVDDGSTDATAHAIHSQFANEPRVRVLRKPNGGKATAINAGVRVAKHDFIISLDADTLFLPTTIPTLIAHFADERVGAVSGNVKVGNARNVLTRWQKLEYVTSQNFDRRAYDLLNCVPVVPGAVGAWRRKAIEEAGLYSPQTLAEDTDMTFSVRRLGYRIVTDNAALAYTEAPETLRTLGQQRFRWSFGTLQCLWKHRGALFNPRYGAFGWVALPSLWLYSVIFQAVSPMADFSLVWAMFHYNFTTVAFYYALFFVAELISAAFAFGLDGENPRILPWLFLQRFLYRQLMYYVIIKSLARALSGTATGWGKFARSGTAAAPEPPAAVP